MYVTLAFLVTPGLFIPKFGTTHFWIDFLFSLHSLFFLNPFSFPRPLSRPCCWKAHRVLFHGVQFRIFLIPAQIRFTFFFFLPFCLPSYFVSLFFIYLVFNSFHFFSTFSFTSYFIFLFLQVPFPCQPYRTQFYYCVPATNTFSRVQTTYTTSSTICTPKHFVIFIASVLGQAFRTHLWFHPFHERQFFSFILLWRCLVEKLKL